MEERWALRTEQHQIRTLVFAALETTERKTSDPLRRRPKKADRLDFGLFCSVDQVCRSALPHDFCCRKGAETEVIDLQKCCYVDGVERPHFHFDCQRLVRARCHPPAIASHCFHCVAAGEVAQLFVISIGPEIQFLKRERILLLL